MESKNQNISSIEEFLKTKAADKSAVFVFATDVVCQSWADWCVTGHTNVKSVAMSRFLAWDTFKGKFVSAQKEGYSAVPSVLRKLFVYTLIAENAENQIFKKIINPLDEYRKDAYSFADWISKNLSSLHIWKKRLDANQKDYGNLDDEDKDYELLYARYSDFLEKNKLFEPAWVDEIKLTDNKNHYYIFYPEQLEDFIDYEEIFSKAGNVTFLHLPEETVPPECFEFPDSRSELRKTILRIIALVNSEKADWTEIALTVPDFETYRPYLKRELELYSVPYVLKMGEPLSKNCAGRIFKEILDCHNEEFSFDSVRTLLLDETLPWKKEYESLKSDLIRIGNEHRCICFFDEEKDGKTKRVDIWQRVLFNLSKEDASLAPVREFYNKFKHYVELFFEEGTTFEKISADWYQFRNYFLETKDFENNADFESSNLILSRCITHLKEIIDVEKKFGGQLKISSPFEFFVKILDEKSYKMQQSSEGLSVFDYKLSASANFKYQFVINASQKMLEIQKKRLNFLSQEKRRKLGFVDDDSKMNTSDVTAKLYARKTEAAGEDFVHFSYAVDSFSGFAIPHASLKTLEKAQPADLTEDYILAEKERLLRFARNDESGRRNDEDKKNRNDGSGEFFITQRQKEALGCWKKSSIGKDEKEYFAGKKIKENVEYVLKTNRGALDKIGGKQGHIKISARGDLEKFFPCPRKWVLSQILHFHDDTLDTSLMQNYDMGNLNHKILEDFISLYKGKKLPWYDGKNDSFIGDDENSSELNAQADVTEKMKAELYGGLVENAIKREFRGLPLVILTLASQKDKIADVIWSFLKILLLPFGKYSGKKDCVTMNGIGGCSVAGLEQSLAGDFGNYDLFGKLDCLVKTPDGDFIILDYKNTSASVPSAAKIKVDTDTGILGDFQMPLYAELVACPQNREILKGGLFAAYFYAIKDGKKTAAFDETEGIKDDKRLKLADFEATMETLKEYAELFNSQTEKFDFAPRASGGKKDRLNVNRYENCVSCQFRTVCRTTYTVAEKKIKETKARD